MRSAAFALLAVFCTNQQANAGQQLADPNIPESKEVAAADFMADAPPTGVMAVKVPPPGTSQDFNAPIKRIADGPPRAFIQNPTDVQPEMRSEIVPLPSRKEPQAFSGP